LFLLLALEQSGESVAGDFSSTDKKLTYDKKEASTPGSNTVQFNRNNGGSTGKHSISKSAGLSSSSSSTTKSALKNTLKPPLRTAATTPSEDYKDKSRSSSNINERASKKTPSTDGAPPPPPLSSSSGKTVNIETAMQNFATPTSSTSRVRICVFVDCTNSF